MVVVSEGALTSHALSLLRARVTRAPWRSRCGRGCASATPTLRCWRASTRSSTCVPSSSTRAPLVSLGSAENAPSVQRGHPPPHSHALTFLIAASHHGSQWIVTASVFQRAAKEMEARNTFDESTMRVEDDGTVSGTYVGSETQDKYSVRVRVRNPNSEARAESTADGVENPNLNAIRVDVSCTCPAAKSVAPRAQRPEVRSAEVPRRQPEKSCEHSCALLLWRARTVTATTDPNASNAPRAPARVTADEEQVVPRAHSAREHPDARRSIPAAAPFLTKPNAQKTAPAAGSKKRRLPPSLARSAAVAERANVATSASPRSVSRAKPHPSKPNPEPEEVVAVRREPPPVPRASASGARRDIVSKVKAVGDAALVAAANRAVLGEGAMRANASGSMVLPGVAKEVSKVSSAFAPPVSPGDARAPSVSALFASLLPEGFRTPMAGPAAAETVEPVTVSARSASAPVGRIPAPESAARSDGPKKMSFAELMASGGL